MAENERRLAAIMFTDMVGYTALGQRNESLSLALVEEQRRLIRPILAKHNGREVKTLGDAFLVEFLSALDAVRCAYNIQRATREFNIPLTEDHRVHLRIGIHLGDVVESQGDISGDAVNIASRIEPLAEDDGVCFTRQVYDQVQNKFELQMTSIGSKQLKNVNASVEVYKMVMPWKEDSLVQSERLDEKRIAVLPFVSMSSDPNDAYFADGVTEEIISTLSGISAFSVISRTSVMGYRGTTKKVREIGKELQVGSILEGSLRKVGNRIRITTQLIDVANDRHLWAQNYDRELDDVFAVQSEIAGQVADNLRVKILPQEQINIKKTPTSSPEAHELYLRGRYYWNERKKDSLFKAIGLYQAAIELDPNYSLAYSGIADSYSVLGDHQHIPYVQASERARENASKAVQLDKTSAEAHASLANAIAGSDPASSEMEFRESIELSPSYATAHHWYGILLIQTARREDALEEALKAQKLDPLSPMIATFVGIAYDALGKYVQAENQFLRALELQPEFLPAIGNLTYAYMHEKKFEEAEDQVHAMLKIASDEALRFKLWLAAIYAMAGKEADARKMMAEAQAIPNPGHLYEDHRIIYFVALGDLNKAVELIGDEYERGAGWLGSISFDPFYTPVRNNPKVESILKRVGAIH